LKLVTSNLVYSFGLPKPIIKLDPQEKVGVGELSNILGFPYNIFGTAEASNFKSGRQVGFAKAHHKIPHRRKSGRGPGL